MNDVAILAPHPLAFQIAGPLQFRYDTLHRPLRNPNRDGHFTQGLLRGSGQTNQNMGMICKKIPVGRGCLSHKTPK